MRVQASRLVVLGLAAAASLSISAAAHAAMDAKKVADHLVATVAESNNSKATYTRSAAQGNDVVITGFKVTNNRGGTFELPTIVVTNPTERSQGGFTAARITMDKAKVVNEGITMTWDTASAEQAISPSIDEIKAKTRITPFTRLAIGKLAMSGGDIKAPINIAAFNIAVTDVKDGVPRDGKLTIDGIVLPAALFSDAQSKAMLTQLGYTDGFTASLVIEGAYANDTDTGTLRAFSLQADRVGKITIGSTVAGIPLSKLSDQGKASEVLATAMLRAASIRFENAGVVERVLDMQAKASGMDRKAFVTNMSGAMPFLLSSFVANAAFRTKLAAAVTTFLNDPKSIQITSNPPNPVPVMQVVGAATSAPDTLPDVLSLDIAANR